MGTFSKRKEKYSNAKRERRFKHNQLNQSFQVCKVISSMVILLFAFTGVIYSSHLIASSGENKRENVVDAYEKDEVEWNTTYLEQMKGIQISVIKD